MIDKNGNKVHNTRGSYDLEFALKEINFYLKHYRIAPNVEKAYNIAKLIYKYLEHDGSYPDMLAKFYEIETIAPHSNNDDFIWHLVYIRRLFSDWYKGRNKYEDAFSHRHASAKYFELICKINPSFHNRRVRVIEYTAASNIIINSGKRRLNDERFVEPLKRAIALVDELALDRQAVNNVDFMVTAKNAYLSNTIYMEREGDTKGEAWLNSLKNLIYHTGNLYCLRPNTYLLKDLALFYKIAFRCNGYATPEVLVRMDEICRVAEKVAEKDSDSEKAIEEFKTVRNKYANHLGTT